MMSNIGTVDKKFAVRLKEDGVFFTTKLLNIQLHYYQQEVMNDYHRFIAMCWSRQIGKTTLLSIKATHKAVTFIATPEKKEFLIMVLSQDRERAREFYNLILSHILSSPLLSNMIVGDAKQSETRLVNGARIINKAAGRDGRSLRGYSVDLLIIDEADFVPEPVFVAAEQCTSSTRGSIWLISTPFRKGTTFYKYFKDGELAKAKHKDPSLLDEDEEPHDSVIGREYGFKTYHHTYEAGLIAIKPNGDPQLDPEFIEKKRRSMAKWEFQQEYLAEWADDIAAYFNEKQINNCIDKKFTERDYVYHRTHRKQIIYVGIDFAKHKDRTVVFAITRLENGEYDTMFTEEYEGRDWDKQLIAINLLMADLKPNEIWVDKTGLGDVMLDIMMNGLYMPNGDKNYMLGRISENTAVSFQLNRKSSLYQHLQYMIGNGLINLPNHKRMKTELTMLQYEKLPGSEWVRIHAPDTSDDIHDDYPDALALAVSATAHEVKYIPLHMKGTRKALLADRVPKRRVAQFEDEEDLDTWERKQVREKGAQVYRFGERREKVGQTRGRGYQRGNLKRTRRNRF
jgi:hypothetical protein